MKRIPILILLLCLLLPALSAAGTGLDGVYDEVCPINTAVQLETRADGTFIALTMFNATAHPISYVEFSLYLYDADGAPARNDDTHYFYAYAPELSLQPLTDKTLYWSVEKYAGAAEIQDFRVEKVIFSGDETWIRSETPFAQPFLYATNAKTDGGRYLLDESRELTLVDYSYSSESRTWYVWDDASGWVAFSRDLVAHHPVWTPGVAIKLEINDDPSLFLTEYFHVTPSPSLVAMHPYATGETLLVQPVESAFLSALGTPSAVPAHTVDSGIPVGDVPLCVGLWDYTEIDSRIWYIWDGTAWAPFSYDRAPICEIWRTGPIYIKLAYPDSEAVYALTVKEA